MRQIRDLDQTTPGESLQRLVAENSSLKQPVRHLGQEHRTLRERLEAARSSNLFADRRIVALEAQLLDPTRADTARSCD